MQKKYWLLLVMALQMVCMTYAQHARPRWRGMVTTEPMVHDPVMAYEDSVYHLYSTGQGIQVITSRDFKTWTVSPRPLMTVMPAWTQDSVPGFRQHVWAPDVTRWHGRWYIAYSCSTFGRNTSAIGLLSSNSLSENTIWQDEGYIVCSREERDNWNAIDPNFIIDDDNQPWLVFGSFWDGIQLVRLDSTLHIQSGVKPMTIARRHPIGFQSAEPNPTSQYAGDNAIEAPFIFKHGTYYYLFVSWDYCCRGEQSTYRVAVGRSKTVNGPYLDTKGIAMNDGGGTILMEGDQKTYEAAGHCAVYQLDDKDVFICHGYSIQEKGAPLLIRKSMTWSTDGWPILSDLRD